MITKQNISGIEVLLKELEQTAEGEKDLLYIETIKELYRQHGLMQQQIKEKETVIADFKNNTDQIERICNAIAEKKETDLTPLVQAIKKQVQAMEQIKPAKEVDFKPVQAIVEENAMQTKAAFATIRTLVEAIGKSIMPAEKPVDYSVLLQKIVNEIKRGEEFYKGKVLKRDYQGRIEEFEIKKIK